MNMKQNDQTPSDNPIESEAFDRLHAKKDGYNVNDRDHDFQSTSTQESQQQMSHSFPWSLRNVVMLASLCVVVVLTFAALSMIAPFYPQEVSYVSGERHSCTVMLSFFKIKNFSQFF